MGTRTGDKLSLTAARRNRKDLIDLSQEIDENKSCNNILDLFDPLSHANDQQSQNANHLDRSRPINRSIQPIELRRRDRRLRPLSACPLPSQKRQIILQKPIKAANGVEIYVTSDTSSISKGSGTSHGSDRSSNRTASLSNDTDIPSEFRRLSLRSNSFKSISGEQDNLGGDFDLEISALAKGTEVPQNQDVDDNKLRLTRKSQRSSQELTLLTAKLKSFRAKFKHHDKTTNSGLVLSPTLYSSKVRDMSVKIVITSPLASEPINFTCNVSTTIEHLISHAVCTMFDNLQEGDNMENYMLKVTGKDEFFESGLCLADYALVSHCWKFDLDVQLTLIKTESAKRPFQRTGHDDFRCKSLLSPDDLLSSTSLLKYSDLKYESLNITIDTFEKEAQRLYWDVTNKSTCLQTQSLLQVTKAICSLMLSCETAALSESSNNLAELCRSYKNEGESLTDEDRYKMIEVIQHAIKRLLENMRRLLRLMSNSLPVDYEVEETDLSCSKSMKNTFVDTSIDLVKDQVTINVQLVAQLKPDWTTKYQEYHFIVELMHGDASLCPASLTSSIRQDTSFFPRLLFDEEITLSVQYSNVPREARLVLTLIGTEIPLITATNQLTVPGEDGYPIRRSLSATSIASTAPMYSSSPRNSMTSAAYKPTTEPINSELARSIVYIFDQELNLRQGDILVSLHPLDTETNDDIYLETLADRNDPVLVLGMKNFPPEKRIYFPCEIDQIKSRNSSAQGNQTLGLDYDKIDPGEKYVIESIIDRKQCYEELMEDERDILWKNRLYLTSKQHALPKVLLSAPSWSLSNLGHIYDLIDIWSPMEPVDSIQLLLPTFPDCYVRTKAVEWISKLNDDEICDYLPQLLQAFRYEKNIDCPLFWLLIERAMKNARIANLLYWALKLNTSDKLFRDRSETLTSCLLHTCGAAFWKSIDKQENLLGKLTSVSNEIKKVRDSQRQSHLRKKLEDIQDFLTEQKPTMPWAPSLEVCDLEIQSCSYFPSNTLPLKLAFRSCEESCNRQIKFHTYDTIFKMGDDLRQDMLAIQMIRIMEKLWLREGLDLRMVTFDCIATGERQGMVEMVQNAETLRKIQQNSSFFAGPFISRAIDDYIRLWNTSELEYRTALDKFLHSCAGYSVATYILGICDRHNDNIMITTSGHLFHIDFGKFLGDAQMMGSIKRDRTPFVLTADMAYVINGGEKQSKKFQTFIELCTMGFNIIRRHRNLFLNLFSLMSSAKIHGLNSESVKYIDKMLMPNLTETEAMAKFTLLIHECLNARSTQVNFLIHNLAQMRFTSDSSRQSLLSFVPKTFSIQTDGRIESLELIHLYKKYEPEKQYYYVVRVWRQGQPDYTDITRTFREFSELQMKLNVMFPGEHFHDINRSTSSFLTDYVGYRNNTREVAQRRFNELITFLRKLLLLPPEISQCDLVYTFFHPILRDQASNALDASTSSESSSTFGHQEYSEAQRNALYLGSNGQVKLSLTYINSSLNIMVMHAKNLICPENSNGPNCYAKTYLLPDPNKQSKRKTRLIRQNCHPSFMELIVYQIPPEALKRLTLQVSIWHSELVQQKAFMGAALIPLDKVDFSKETAQWYPLKNY